MKRHWRLLSILTIVTLTAVGYLLIGIGAKVTAQTSCGTCNWYGTNYPVCCNQNTGWGWENNRSCIGCQDCINAGQSCSNCTKCGSGGGGGGTSGSCPSSLTCPSGIRCGCYTVSGLGANKRALTAAGGSQYMMAAAMMETEKMDTNYAFCDGKSGDSCCCGVTKANFYEARTAGCANTSSGYSTWCQGMNGSRSTDVACWNRIRSYWGNLYWAVHRNGESGKNNPNTTDIQNFKAANDWTNQQLNGHLTDDVRFWCDIPAI